VLRTGELATHVWSLDAPPRKLRRGDVAQITFANDLPVSTVLNWRGIDGASACEPLLVRPPLAQGKTDAFKLPMRQAGTYLCDLSLPDDGTAQPARSLALIVAESEPPLIDRDELLLIEGWRLRPDGAAIAPGVDPAGTVPVYTVNGEIMPEIRLLAGERARFRLINGLHRSVIALKFEHHDTLVMALDSQPAEPFLARNSALALAPGARADFFLDVKREAGDSSILLHDGETARPVARLIVSPEPSIRKSSLPPPPALASNNLPERLDLKTALRAELAFGKDQKNWVRPPAFTIDSPPAFNVKLGRAVVLSLINRAAATVIVHLHGHHFRLLDRLDDGWKPFWLDTIAIDAGQTQRIAFAAEYAGRWLIEAAETRWEAPRLVRWYNVE
jgi:FtsP/CotA-like multicopper oxidase with cupredoxin domain